MFGLTKFLLFLLTKFQLLHKILNFEVLEKMSMQTIVLYMYIYDLYIHNKNEKQTVRSMQQKKLMVQSKEHLETEP